MKYNGLFYVLLGAIVTTTAAAAGNTVAAGASPAAPSNDEAEALCSERSNHDPATCSNSQQQSPAGDQYCVNTTINSEYEILTNQNCFHDISAQNAIGDFVSFHNLPPGQIAPILWRNNNNSDNNSNIGGKIVSQYGFQVTLPPNLIPTLLNYTSHLGIIDKFRDFTSTSPIPPTDEHNGQFVSFGSNRWYAQRPAKHFQSNMHWISPADEKTQEEYLRVLFQGGFGDILEKIGKALLLDGLVAYHLTFLAVSKSIRGYTHHDTTATGGRVYNVIIPLLLEEDVEPELILIDDVIHGTLECDYTKDRGDGSEWKHGGMIVGDDGIQRKSGMRLAATVYIADINELNAKEIADGTLTQIFPIADEEWLYAQLGRHWWKDDTVDQEDDRESGDDTTIESKKTKKKEWVDKGRARFSFGDELEDCNIRARKGMCETDEEETRTKCLKSCNIYIEDGPTSTKKLSVEEAGDEAMYQVCTQNRTAVETCRKYQDDTDVDGEFVVPKTKLEAGEMLPIIWRESGSQITPYAFQVGLPPELTTELLSYCNELGMTDLFREFVGENPIEALEDGQGPNGKFVTLTDGNRWYAQRPERKWTSNMHWIGPADEKTHEEYLKVLAKGNLDAVLDGIGKYLGLDSLVAYHLTFMAVSHSEKGYIHRDTHTTGGSVYNIIIPLILDEEALPELEMTDWWDESEMGSLKYQIGTASMMGDDAMHGTQACDYREKKGMRMAATVYVADINRMNYEQITSGTLTQIFPLPDEDWLWAQRGRHWGNGASMKTDKGRETFSVSDHYIDCEERRDEGMCESDSAVNDEKSTRKQCLKSCNVYVDDGGHEAWYVDRYDPEQEYEEWYYLTPFFDNRWEYSCVDSSDECEDGAARGLCLTDPAHMKEIGCNRSCLFCIAADSRDLFSLGVTQVLESDDDDANERDVPDPTKVLEVMMKTEQYLVNKVFVATDYEHVRLSCRNFDEKCAIWAAQGYCDDERGEMGKLCPAACQDCQMIDYRNRCPIDEDTNVFGPGDMNKMFERILEECGEDTSAYSSKNLPAGCNHPVGEITVISSPYDDMKPYLSEEDTKIMDEFTPLPWMLLIDGFLSDKECDQLISFGNTSGYERSGEYSGDFDIDGSPTFTQSDSRTSENTFCDSECANDPIVQGVLKRMESITTIPRTNYESLQLVRYEVGQYYHQHHDYSDTMTGTTQGHRILTFFMYLNDVEEGGGTKFQDLNFTAQPKRGSALIWPSVTDEGVDILDEWTYHEALPVEKGIKFGANAWIHQRDYQGVPEYCS